MILQRWGKTCKMKFDAYVRAHALTIRKLVQLGRQDPEVIMRERFLCRNTVPREAFQHLGGQVFSFRGSTQARKVEGRIGVSLKAAIRGCGG